ncbi:MAG: hypothetical protein KatS3mg111_2572 [Pirellulaceae bacterium]|nr:MAG: hypothetical protein KatS3mg111_2572 [Pirellulaceae bacterium]
MISTVAEKILKRLEAKFGHRPQRDDPLAFIGVDSIGMAELTVELEKEFGVRVEDDILAVETVGELIEYVEMRLKEPND